MRLREGILFFLSFFLFLTISRSQPDDNIGFNRDIAAGEEDVRNEIIKSLFFRGRVADAIIEKGLVKEVSSKDFHTYAEMREYIISWCYKNPDKAAYLYSSGHENGVPSVSGGSYKVPNYVINPRFREIIDNLDKTAKNTGLSQEESRLESAFMFEGGGFSGNLNVPASSGQGGASSVSQNFFKNYKLKKDLLSSEERNAVCIRESLSREYGFFRGEKKLDEVYSGFESKYLEFSIAAAESKGGKNISESSALALEKSRMEFRKFTAAFKLSLFSADLRREASVIPESVLKGALLGLASDLEREGGLMTAPDYRMDGVYTITSEAYGLYSSMKKEASLYRESASELNSVLGFSCFFDYLSWVLLDEFIPGNVYSESRKNVTVYSAQIKKFSDALLDRKIYVFGGGESDKFFKVLREAEENSKRLGKISLIHRKLQFYPFEFLFLPFDLKAGRGDPPVFKPYAKFWEIR